MNAPLRDIIATSDLNDGDYKGLSLASLACGHSELIRQGQRIVRCTTCLKIAQGHCRDKGETPRHVPSWIRTPGNKVRDSQQLKTGVVIEVKRLNGQEYLVVETSGGHITHFNPVTTFPAD